MNTKRVNRGTMGRLFSVVVICVLALSLIAVPGSGQAPASTQLQSVIVQGADLNQVARLVEAHGGRITSRLPIIHGVGAMIPGSTLAALRVEKGITQVTPNFGVKLTASTQEKSNKKPEADYQKEVGADIAWQQGVNGSGVSVAIVDTGLANINNLAKTINGRNGRIVGWVDFVDGRKSIHDPNGHGTHVAGIIANNEKGHENLYNSIAPGVNLVGVRVLDETGNGSYEKVIQGIQWVLDMKDRYNIRVMNLSIEALVQSPYWADPLGQAVMAAWANGVVVVTAAGNTGPNAMSIGVPGNVPYVITVGAFTDNFTPADWNDDYITPFSSAGPTLDGFVKPDVVAPGAHMISVMRANAYLVDNNQAVKVKSDYYQMAGTSLSSAVVSGIAALVIAKNPDLTPDQVKYRIMHSAFPWVNPTTTEALYSMWQQGAGRVNAPDAVFNTLEDRANLGLDINADLAGTQHYQGYSYYNEQAGEFRLYGDFSGWAGGYGAWSGGYGAWSGGYGAWSGGYGAWSGGYGAWSGGYGAWSGGYGAWSGGYGAWSGGYGAWSGGYGAWSGGYGAWSGTVPWAETSLAQPIFVTNFLEGTPPDITAKAAIGVSTWKGDE